ncbi:MAG: carbamoyltransferase HypF [Candidatus Aminicenantes bacterium]|nr:carbamoyltransferase HypF [Candidatus Aminicenantes bacterium]
MAEKRRRDPPARRRGRGKRARGRAVRLLVTGVVQGVGFRPFVYRLAHRLGLRGWVKNVGPGVEIHLESPDEAGVSAFLRGLKRDKPPLARIESIRRREDEWKGLSGFRVRESRQGKSFVFISPDIATCESCRAEVFDPKERRFRYPFTNCTDCGPRYTIVRSLPYDRARTTMAGFPLCPDCLREFRDPLDRRYHAQPVACPACGPRVRLIDTRTGKAAAGDGIEAAAVLIKKGRLLAVKGLGGYHLMADALNPKAVGRLRTVKARKTKPLALMAAGIEAVERYAFIGPKEREALLSVNRPIVLLKKKKDIPGIAPNLNEIGFMLPYTPLHHLLLEDIPLVVATSSNRKDSPIMKDRREGIDDLCDFILDHNRPIEMRADDSVLRIAAGRPLFARRARGYVPYPQRVPDGLAAAADILALGGELKATVSVYKNGYVVTSQFLGDQDEYPNHRYLEETVRHLCRLFSVRPAAVVSDLHPDFHTTRMARAMGIPHFQVQHHFAHVLAPMLEHGIPPGRRVLGVSLDGYGYGADGEAWGGEFLLVDYSGFERFARLKPVPMPGGDAAARQPWRMALSYLQALLGREALRHPSLKSLGKKKLEAVLEMTAAKLRSPLTSSCGRLFDAASWLAGTAPREMEFEAEAAMRFEAAASPDDEGHYVFELLAARPIEISFLPSVAALWKDVAAKTPLSVVSARFHQTLARAVLRVAQIARRKEGIETVALVGGVFLNRRLLEASLRLLEGKGFRVLRPENYSPNDESLSLGQIGYALNRLKKKR